MSLGMSLHVRFKMANSMSCEFHLIKKQSKKNLSKFAGPWPRARGDGGRIQAAVPASPSPGSCDVRHADRPRQTGCAEGREGQPQQTRKATRPDRPLAGPPGLPSAPLRPLQGDQDPDRAWGPQESRPGSWPSAVTSGPLNYSLLLTHKVKI